MAESHEERMARKERDNLRARWDGYDHQKKLQEIIARLDRAKALVQQDVRLEDIADITNIIIQ